MDDPVVKAMSGLADSIDRFAEASDQAAVTKAQLEMRAAYTEKYLNPESGEFRTRRGIAAEGMYDDGKKFFSDFMDNAKKTLSPRQAKMFNVTAANEMRGYAQQLASHQGMEVLNHYKQENEAQIKSAIDLAARDPLNPDTIRNGFESLTGLYAARGKYEGWGNDYTALQLKEAQGKMVRDMAVSVSVENPVLALGMLKTFRGHFRPDDYAGLLHTLESKAEDATIQSVKQLLLDGRKDDARNVVRRFSGGSVPGQPRGAANNNYGNVKTDENNFYAYKTKTDGLNAVAERVLRYQEAEKFGKARTISQVMHIYAPASENDTGGYVTFIARETGLDPDQPINFRENPQALAKLVRAISKMEVGAKHATYADEELNQGVADAIAGKKPETAGAYPVAGSRATAGAEADDQRQGILRPSTALALQGMIDEQGDRERAEARRVMASEAPNAFAWYGENGDTSPLDKAQEKILRLGDAETTRAFLDQRAIHEDLRPIMQTLEGDSFAMQNETVVNWFSERTSPENAASMAAARKDVLEGLRKRQEAFKKDPCGYVAASKELQDESLTSEERIRKSYELQDSVGQSVAFKRSPLPKEAADKLNLEYQQAEPARQAAMIVQYAREFGKYAGDVFEQAKMPDFAVAISGIADNLTPSVVASLVMSASAPPDTLPPLTDATRGELQGSAFLRTAQDVARTMSVSRGQRDFTASVYRTFENHLRSGGKLGDIEDHFFTINDGNMKILAPRSMEKPGIETALKARSYELTMDAREIKNPALRFTMLNAYDNGQWVFDGGSGFVCIDAATGMALADGEGKPVRVGIEDVDDANVGAIPLEEE